MGQPLGTLQPGRVSPGGICNSPTVFLLVQSFLAWLCDGDARAQEVRRKHAVSLPFPSAALHLTPCPAPTALWEQRDPAGMGGEGCCPTARPCSPLPGTPFPACLPCLHRCSGPPAAPREAAFPPGFAPADGMVCACVSPAAPAEPGRGSFFSAFASFLSDLQVILPLHSRAPDPNPGVQAGPAACSSVAVMVPGSRGW